MYLFAFMSALLFLLADISSAHRYICNGINAQGEERHDECNLPCDKEHAARWADATLTILVSTAITPAGISPDEWWQVVQDAFKVWESVPGVNVRFILKREEAAREFGTNASVHELFVITDTKEWLEKTLVGPMGVLGATLPTYICKGPDATPKREIIDSDLVINATGSVLWKLNCTDDDCVDPLTTLVHEIGHWLGLDHPCLLCSWSIMSARAGFDLIYPVFDDMQGIRSLYPDAENTHGFGSACIDNSDCSSNLCVEDKGNKYCSNNCATDENCYLGTFCWSTDSAKYCVFATGEASLGKKEGDSCDLRPCVEPLICAGAERDSFYCFKPCKNNQSCKANETCTKVKKNVGICVPIKHLGESCDGHELCADDLYCLIENGLGFCRQPCGLVDPHGTGCPTGSSCKIYDAKREICTPDELRLNSGSMDFSDTSALERVNKTSKEKSFKKIFSGCSALGNASNITMLWGLLMLLGLSLRRYR